MTPNCSGSGHLTAALPALPARRRPARDGVLAMPAEALAHSVSRSADAARLAEYAELLAAARAAVAAAARGDSDPAGWVRAVLEARRQLPAPGARPDQVAADAAAAMRCARGWTS